MNGSGSDDGAGFNPIMTIDGALRLAMEMIGNQRLDFAAEILERVLAVEPENPSALNSLGILQFHLKGAEAAVEFLSQAAKLAPANASILNNLGNAHVEAGDIDAAVHAYEEAIKHDTGLGDPYSNLASIRKHRGEMVEAEALLRRAIALNRANGYAHRNLGAILMGTGRAVEAVDHFWKAVALIPDKSLTAPFLASAYWHAGLKDEARSFVRNWALSDPDDPQAKHLRASFTGEDVPDRASDEYVAVLFDNFAGSFDEKLDSLDYRAPAIIGDAVSALLGQPEGNLQIIDAGCGTGKCCVYLRPYARQLTGVDLSPKMLAEAVKRQNYDTLDCAELTGFLEQVNPPVDLIVSADTLCYFGRLESFAAASANALRVGGSLIFTVEALSSEPANEFELMFAGRYRHSEAYVCRTLEAACFTIVDCRCDRLRNESGLPVAGLVVIATKN